MSSTFLFFKKYQMALIPIILLFAHTFALPSHKDNQKIKTPSQSSHETLETAQQQFYGGYGGNNGFGGYGNNGFSNNGFGNSGFGNNGFGGYNNGFLGNNPYGAYGANNGFGGYNNNNGFSGNSPYFNGRTLGSHHGGHKPIGGHGGGYGGYGGGKPVVQPIHHGGYGR